MRYFIFNLKDDKSLIPSFLKTSDVAHKKIQPQTVDWFIWKFRDNPFGESILACAEEDHEIIGCVGFGPQQFIYNEEVIQGGVSFETFVHPMHQGKGIFKKLAALGEEEARLRGWKFLLNFPNSNSLAGFKSRGWTELNLAEYWLRFPKWYLNLLKMKDFRHSFQSAPSNLSECQNLKFSGLETSLNHGDEITTYYTDEYIRWRFQTYPIGHYIYVSDRETVAIGRLGSRGQLTEIQVLHVTTIKRSGPSVSSLEELFRKRISFDIISFPISRHNNLRNKLITHLYVKVPSKTKTCYLNLDINTTFSMDQLNFMASIFHTY